ncbi:MAG: glycosyltransferase family 2 protein [Gemmatimonadaceae bacterium]
MVSIIIPARNAGPWIQESLQSALAQTHRALEVLVVDSGSTDDTVDRARIVADERVRFFRAPASGPSAARNAGLDAARGEFIQFLDADDALVPDKIERQLDVLLETGADVAWGSFVRAIDDQRPLAAHTAPLVEPAIGSDVQRSLLEDDGFVHLGATLTRRSAIGAIRFDDAVRVVEDVRFLFALAENSARFIHAPMRSGYVMREHESAARASRVGSAEFWRSCGGLAMLAESAWRAAGTLTAERAATLARVQVGVARHLVQSDARGARAAIERAKSLTPEYYKAFPPRLRAIVRALGFERAEKLARVVRSARRPLWVAC